MFEGYLLTFPPDPLFCGYKAVTHGAHPILVSSASDQVRLEAELSKMFEH